jgi:hypothetical protein
LPVGIAKLPHREATRERATWYSSILDTVADNPAAQVNRSDRVLRNVTWSVIGLAILAIAALLIGRGVGLTDFSTGVWPAVAVLPLIGLPIGFLLLVAQLVVSAVRRSRAAKDAGE